MYLAIAALSVAFQSLAALTFWIVPLALAQPALRLYLLSEHMGCPEVPDMFRNTRTTRARWWERLLIAPNRVNYHLEHHLLMTVPLYNLPRMHRMLKERGALEEALLSDDYFSVFSEASARAA